MNLQPVLQIHGLSHCYAQLSVLNQLNWCIEPGQRWWLSGANGAGKSTLLNVIAGNVPVQQGSLHFCGRDITRVGSIQRSRAGMSRSFQLPQLFASMSVADHWRAVGVLQHDDLRKPVELSYAERKRLDVELTLAQPAHLFLLDEPTAGISHEQAREFYASLVRRFPDVAMLIIEHEPARVQGFSTHAARLRNASLELDL
jgi:branched-chain amino acid transport system ATP-binding protein